MIDTRTDDVGIVGLAHSQPELDRRETIGGITERNRLELETRRKAGLKDANTRFRKDALEILLSRGLLHEAYRFLSCESCSLNKSDSPSSLPARYRCHLPICRSCNERESTSLSHNYSELIHNSTSVSFDRKRRHFYALELTFASPYSISRGFISRVRDSVSLFWKEAFLNPNSPAFDSGAGAISALSFLSRSKPQEFFPHAHLLVWARTNIPRELGLRPTWREVTRKFFNAPAKHFRWEEVKERKPGIDPVLDYLKYVVKAEVYFNPELAVDILQALASERTDKIGRRTSFLRRVQARGIFSGRGKEGQHAKDF
jgi:hypothetical protein